MGNINADPTAAEALCYGNCCAASAKGIEDNVAFVGAGLNDPTITRESRR